MATRPAPPPFDTLLSAARTQPARPDVAIALASRALGERREVDAIPAIATAAATPAGRGSVTLIHLLGLLHRAVGDLAPAITALDQALALNPNDAILVHARARAALEAGQPSLGWFEHARALAPSDGDVILGQAAALVAEADGEDADRLLAGMLAQHPGWIPGHAAIAQLRFAAGHDRHGERDEIATIDAALATAPRDPRLHHLKVSLLNRAERGDAARGAMALALDWCPDEPTLRELDAVIATETGDLNRADAAFARIATRSGDTVIIHRLRHLLRRGRPAAVDALAAALPIQQRALAWPYLALAWRLLDDPRAAWLDREDFVRVVDFGEDWPLLAPLAATLRDLHRSHSQPLDQSVRGGTQTDGPLLARLEPTLMALRDRLCIEIVDYIAALPARDPAHPLLGRVPRHPRFTGSWSVRLGGGGFHAPHVHGDGWLSSAFYVALPPAGGAHDGWLTLGEPQPSLGLDLPPTRLVEPKPGRLVLFPSTRWHGTRAFGAGERLTVAFDVA